MSLSSDVLLTLIAAMAAVVPSGAAERPADLVVLNGKILTVDERFSTAEAVAIRDGVFVQVGTNGEAKKLIGDRTKVLDANGRTVVPGLIETHVHAIGVGHEEVLQHFVQLG